MIVVRLVYFHFQRNILVNHRIGALIAPFSVVKLSTVLSLQ